MKNYKSLLTLPLVFCGMSAVAELAPLDEADMSAVNGQGGVYLSGEFTINKNGGPLWRPTADLNDEFADYDDFGGLKEVRNCGTDLEPKECGLRFAIKLNENSEGWYVLDDVSGGLAFEGLTLRTREAGQVIDYDQWDAASSSYAVVDVDDEIVEVGLPGTVTFDEFTFKYAVANNGEFGVPTADGTPFRQTEIFGVVIDGNITLEGNLLLFPVD